MAFGGALTTDGNGTVTVQTRDAARRRAFIAPLGVLVEIDAGIIEKFQYDNTSRVVALTLAQLNSTLKASSAIVWVESTTGNATYGVTTEGLNQIRGGWQVSLGSDPVIVQVGPS